jgi:hypothetical protein
MVFGGNVNAFGKLASAASFLLLVELFAPNPVGIFERPVRAQSQDYRFCMVTRTAQSDLAQSGSVPGAQAYYSELYQGPDRGKEFLAWLHKRYKKEWLYSNLPYRYVEDVVCYLMSPQNFSDGVKKLQSMPSQKPYNTFTAWPAETGNIQ